MRQNDSRLCVIFTAFLLTFYCFLLTNVLSYLGLYISYLSSHRTMKQNNRIFLTLATLFLVFFGGAILHGQAAAQSADETKEDVIPSPAQEKFQKVDALATPWLDSSDCYLRTPDVSRYPNCTVTPLWGPNRVGARRFVIYDSAGLVWHDFKLSGDDEQFLPWKPRESFEPLAVNLLSISDSVILRMVGESEHWYEVEINENTRETKYLLKNTPKMWAKVSWDHWLSQGGERHGLTGNLIAVNKTDRELLKDKPNGKFIEKPGEYNVSFLGFLKTEGDWAYVKVGSTEPKIIRGWIRWRNGREFLVGCIFNGFKVPQHLPDEGDRAFLSQKP